MIQHLFVGIDVSKDTLDVCISFDGDRFQTQKFANNRQGFAFIMAWLGQQAEPATWRIGLEATSAYHLAVVRYFKDNGVLVLVLNPKQARDLARGLRILRKNDATDARVLALCMKMAWRHPEVLPDLQGQRVQEISRRIDVLVRHRADEKKRLQKPGLCKEVFDSIGRQIVALDKEIRRMETAWLEALNDSDELLNCYTLCLGVPGVGHKTARVVVSELCATPRKRTVKQCVAYAGLAPHERSSGTSLRKPSRIYGTGNKRLRTGLYMGAICTIRIDPECRDLYMRIVGQGKPAKVALVAVMNKTMRRLAAVLNRQSPWLKT